MKHKGDMNEWKERQDAEIVAAYRRIFANYGGLVSVARLYELVAFAPASRFFVSDLQAVRVVSRLVRGMAVARMKGGRFRMYTEIVRRVRQRMAECPRLGVADAVRQVIREPAPEMYISARQVAAIIDKERKAVFARRKARLGFCCDETRGCRDNEITKQR